ncbi:MAG: hypothetical protein MHM6MM_008353 [Cercozoa sp. M6MM]
MSLQRKLAQQASTDLFLPTDDETLVKVTELRGSNVVQVASAQGVEYLARIPARFVKRVWVKKGGFVTVIGGDEEDNVQVSKQVSRILGEQHIQHLYEQGVWPQEFLSAVPRPSRTAVQALSADEAARQQQLLEERMERELQLERLRAEEAAQQQTSSDSSDSESDSD